MPMRVSLKPFESEDAHSFLVNKVGVSLVGTLGRHKTCPYIFIRLVVPSGTVTLLCKTRNELPQSCTKAQKRKSLV